MKYIKILKIKIYSNHCFGIEFKNYIINPSERLLLEFVKKQLGITEDDIKKQGIVKEKIRDYNIDKVLEK